MNSMTIKLGDKLLIIHGNKDGGALLESATVVELKRNLIRLMTESGDTITITR